MSPYVTKEPLTAFLEHCVPLIPGASELCGSVRTLRRYVNFYNGGVYDGYLMPLNVERIRWPKNFSTIEKLIEEQVVSSLAEMPREELQKIDYKMIVSVLKDFQQQHNVRPYDRGYRWALKMRRRALDRAGLSDANARDGVQSSPATTTSIDAAVINIFEDWKGPIPDCIIMNAREEVGGKVVTESGNCDGEILKKTISREEYLRRVPRGANLRGVMENGCFLESDLDESVCLVVDLSGEEDGEMVFKVAGEDADVVIAQLPRDIADRISAILVDIYADDNDPNSLGLPRAFLVNAHGMRGSPPRGKMTTFGLRELIESGGAAYVNTLLNFIGKRGNLYAYLREIEGLICEWLSNRYPEVLSLIREDNCNYHGNKPPYIGEETMIAPRIVISWQLGNEPHFDPKDNGVSVVVWVVDVLEVDLDMAPPDWRFVIQNLRTEVDGKQRDGVSVQLFHGIVIIYDGKKVRHATSIPFDARYTRFGVFHGSTNPRGYKK